MSQTVPLKQPTSRRFMTWMLHSPFRIFMSGIMLITVTGRKSGRAISTPVNLRARRRHAAGHQQDRSDVVEERAGRSQSHAADQWQDLSGRCHA